MPPVMQRHAVWRLTVMRSTVILFDGKKYRFFVWKGTGHVVLTSQGALELKRVEGFSFKSV